MNNSDNSAPSVCLEQLFRCVEQTGEPATIFISPEIGDLEDAIEQIKRKGLRMAPVPPGCISVFPRLPINDDELFHFCKEYCLGSPSTRAEIRRELFFRRISDDADIDSSSMSSNESTFHPYDCVVRIAELCLLVCHSPPSVAAHLHASSPYLQVTPIRDICITIASTLQKETLHDNDETNEIIGKRDPFLVKEEAHVPVVENDQELLHANVPSDIDASGETNIKYLNDLTGLEEVDQNCSIGYFKEKDFDLVTRTSKHYQSGRRVAAVFVRNGVDKQICLEAANSLQNAATKNNLRSQTNGGEPPETGIVGYYDYLSNPTRRKCRETQFMRKHWASIEKGCSAFLRAVDALYEQHAPPHYNLQKKIIPNSYQLMGTVFSTITVNKNFRTAPHTDKGDFKSGLAALCVLKGCFQGCHLAIPSLGKAFQLKPGDVLFFDASLLHGNTEVHSPSKDWERISVVCYLRNGLMSAICETERRKHLNLNLLSSSKSSSSQVINLNAGVDSSPPTYVPAAIVGKLASAQISALSFITDRIANNSGCIISMAMGLGKTLVALTTAFSCFYQYPNDDVLVIAPKPTIPNWMQEISKWASSGLVFNSCIYSDGCASSGFENRIVDFNEKRKSADSASRVGTLMILNPELLQSFISRCSRFKPFLIVVDEGHCLGSGAKRLIENLNSFGCSRRVLLSGTPLQNDATELYRLIKWVYDGVTKVLPQNTFHQLENAILEYTNGNDNAFQEAVKAQEYINEWMKAFVFREIELELPPLHDYLLVCGSSDSQKSVLKTFRECSIKANEHRPAHLSTHPMSYYSLSPAVKRSRLEDSLTTDTFEEQLNDAAASDEAQSQVMEDEAEVKQQGLELTPQGVLLGTQEREQYSYFQKVLTDKDWVEFVRHSGKLTLLLGIMHHVAAKAEKAILFSQYIISQETIALVLSIAGFITFSMRGRDSPERRRIIVAEFSKFDGPCILILSTKIAAFGHDFTEANHVILFDSWWNPQSDAQAIARAYRRNQVRPVIVYRLASELEDQHVIRIQTRKIALFRSIIHDCVSRSSRSEELVDCAEEEADPERRRLWSQLKCHELSGGDCPLKAVYRYSDGVRKGE